MVIPFGVKTVNKNIIYSDTVLNLNDIGGNLVVNVIDDVRNSEFDEILRIIFNENKNVIFNTIQYSRKDRKIYLYTDKPVSISSLKKKGVNEFEYLDYDSTILEKINNDLLTEDSLEPSIVSLYDVWQLYRLKRKRFGEELKQLERNIDMIIHKNFGDKLLSVYDDDDNVRVSTMADYEKNGYFIFRRSENGDLYISESKKKVFCHVNESKLLMYAGDEINKIFDLYNKAEVWKYDRKKELNNSSEVFLVDVDGYSVSAFIGNRFAELLKIELYSYKKKPDIECNSNKILSSIRGREFDLFKKIFVNIEDCPLSIKNELYSYRTCLLKKLEEERVKREKEEKSLSYKLKSFVKKYVS